MSLNTHKMSEVLRSRSIDLENRKLLITNFHHTEQEKDFAEPANCNGFGRIHHFRRVGSKGWPLNPLPNDPASNKLNLPRQDLVLAQLFQNSACNWRCWYCFVPFELLAANNKVAGWLSASELIDLYLKELDRPKIIDLTGGQPDLTPEWVPWMMRELLSRGLQDSVYLWSDDNLSNDYFWKYLSSEDISTIRKYNNYGKVCCFKGYSKDSFSFNTKAEPGLFDQQFQLFSRYLELKIDLYGYATFTSKTEVNIEADMSRFVDRLQELDCNLPLRVIPLEIKGGFTPVSSRMQAEHEHAIQIQWQAIHFWKAELERRFSSEIREKPIHEIPLSYM